MPRYCLFVLFVGLCLPLATGAAEPVRLATFDVDASPPVGSPMAYDPTKGVQTPLSCRGIVLTGASKPIVLCVVDWIGIGNEGQSVFRAALAEAAGTEPGRVAVHAVHFASHVLEPRELLLEGHVVGLEDVCDQVGRRRGVPALDGLGSARQLGLDLRHELVGVDALLEADLGHGALPCAAEVDAVTREDAGGKRVFGGDRSDGRSVRDVHGGSLGSVSEWWSVGWR